MNEGTFKGSSGLEIFYRAWRPSGAVRAVMVVVPGFNAHSAYYGWVGEQLSTNGIATYALDLRGRGRSAGERFYVDSFDDYIADVASFVRLVEAQEPHLPIFMLGHSAGGVVACLYAAEQQSRLAGLVCESFAFQVPAPDLALKVLKGVSHILPHTHVLRLKNEDFSRDALAVAEMDRDPLIAGESQPSKTVAEMIRADHKLELTFPSITLPLLIVHGTADKATKPSGSKLFFEKAGSKDKTLKLYEGYFHDPLNDVGKAIVMRDLLSWLGVRLSRASAA